VDRDGEDLGRDGKGSGRGGKDLGRDSDGDQDYVHLKCDQKTPSTCAGASTCRTDFRCTLHGKKQISS
jgi:hypothetical protein